MVFFSSCFTEKRVGAKYRGNWVYEGYLFLFILGWKSLGHLIYSEQNTQVRGGSLIVRPPPQEVEDSQEGSRSGGSKGQG